MTLLTTCDDCSSEFEFGVCPNCGLVDKEYQDIDDSVVIHDFDSDAIELSVLFSF